MAGFAVRLRGLVERGLAERMFPGAVVYVSRGGQPVFHEAFGSTAYEPSASRPIRLDDHVDLASLTKLYTAALVLRLVEQGTLRLDDPVHKHVPEVEADWTVEDLLAHRTGTTADLLGEAVRCGIRPCEPGQERELWSVIFRCRAEARLAPGQSHYSDVDFLLAQAVCERATGLGLATLFSAELFELLHFCETGFCPPNPDLCVPTERDERWRRRLVVGEVHDEMAATLGGVAGHAGLFSTADEVGRFCEMWLGVGPGMVLDDPTRELALQPRSEEFGLGWRLCNASFFPEIGHYGAVGHLGFTGTSSILFPHSQTVFVLLSNRVYPHRDAAPSRLPLLREMAQVVCEW
jgi:CubicO group peptidase (beta-lactamase class C family)